MAKLLDTETLNALIETQLSLWPEASDNFFRLRDTERRPLHLGALHGAAQYNPARIRSTGASVEKKDIERRKCFLCADNRPKEQISQEWPEGWDFLVNPYPILPVHFTIASRKHEPQGALPLDMATMAESAPSLAFFYNGAKAGASAPDHLHVQAMLKEELPLLRLCEQYHHAYTKPFMSSAEFSVELPFLFVSAVVSPDINGMLTLSKLSEAFGVDADTGNRDAAFINAYMWMGDDGLLRAAVVPRRRHRPACYFAEGDQKMMVSPGAVDMAGLLILPRKEDYDRITEKIAADIYGEVAFAEKLPDEVIKHFNL